MTLNTYIGKFKIKFRGDIHLSRNILSNVKDIFINNVFVRCIINKIYFEKEWFFYEQYLVSKVKIKYWPKQIKSYRILVLILQKQICMLSQMNSNIIALNLIDTYLSCSILKFIVINKLSFLDCISNINKIKVYIQISLYDLLNLQRKVYLTYFCTNNILFNVNIYFLSIFSKIYELYLSLLLDCFYESKFFNGLYSNRLGRSGLHFIAYLKYILDKITTKFVLIFLDLNFIFNTINHKFLLKHFKLPLRWFIFLRNILKSNYFLKKDLFLINIQRGLIVGTLIGGLLSNLLISLIILFLYNYNFYLNYIFCFGNIMISILKENFIFLVMQKVRFILKLIGTSLFKQKFIFFIVNCKFIKIQFEFMGFYFCNRGFFNNKYYMFNSGNSLNILLIKITLIIVKLHIKSLNWVFLELNLLLKKFVFLFIWNFSSCLLFWLDRYLIYKIKKLLIKKYRYRGLRRPFWVKHKFLYLKKNNLLNKQCFSTLYLKEVPFISIKNNRGIYIYLNLPSKIVNLVSIKHVVLYFFIRIYPFYIYSRLYIKHSIDIQKYRLHINNTNLMSFIRQGGLCLNCSTFLLKSFIYSCFFIDKFFEEVCILKYKYKNKFKKLKIGLVHIMCY